MLDDSAKSKISVTSKFTIDLVGLDSSNTVVTNTPVTIKAEVTNEDGAVSYNWTSSSNDVTITNNTTNEVQISSDKDGKYEITVSATDSKNNIASKSFDLIWGTTLDPQSKINKITKDIFDLTLIFNDEFSSEFICENHVCYVLGGTSRYLKFKINNLDDKDTSDFIYIYSTELNKLNDLKTNIFTKNNNFSVLSAPSNIPLSVDKGYKLTVSSIKTNLDNLYFTFPKSNDALVFAVAQYKEKAGESDKADFTGYPEFSNNLITSNRLATEDTFLQDPNYELDYYYIVPLTKEEFAELYLYKINKKLAEFYCSDCLPEFLRGKIGLIPEVVDIKEILSAKIYTKKAPIIFESKPKIYKIEFKENTPIAEFQDTSIPITKILEMPITKIISTGVTLDTEYILQYRDYNVAIYRIVSGDELNKSPSKSIKEIELPLLDGDEAYLVVRNKQASIILDDEFINSLDLGIDKYIDGLLKQFDLFELDEVFNTNKQSGYSKKYVDDGNTFNDILIDIYNKKYTYMKNKYANTIDRKELVTFNTIIFDVAQAYGLTEEETAQFWSNIAQESDLVLEPTNSLTSVKGMAQINLASWCDSDSNGVLTANNIKRQTGYNQLKKYFNQAKFERLVGLKGSTGQYNVGVEDYKLFTSSVFTQANYNQLCEDIKENDINTKNYASVIFSAAVYLYNNNAAIGAYDAATNTWDFSPDSFFVYDYKDSIDSAFASFYKYWSGPKAFKLKQVYDFSTEPESTLDKYTLSYDGTFSVITKLGYYLAYKRIIYEYENNLRDTIHKNFILRYKTRYLNAYREYYTGKDVAYFDDDKFLPIYKVYEDAFGDFYNEEKQIPEMIIKQANKFEYLPYHVCGRLNLEYIDKVSNSTKMNKGVDCIGLPYVILRYLGLMDSHEYRKIIFHSGVSFSEYIQENVTVNNSDGLDLRDISVSKLTGSYLEDLDNTVENLDQLQAGDIVFVNSFSHGGIYLGKDSSGVYQFLNARGTIGANCSEGTKCNLSTEEECNTPQPNYKSVVTSNGSKRTNYVQIDNLNKPGYYNIIDVIRISGVEFD